MEVINDIINAGRCGIVDPIKKIFLAIEEDKICLLWEVLKNHFN